MDGANNGIVLYHYSFSPYARRVTWYLALRGIEYAQVVQPPIMPRPDLEAIGVKYRRIPLMAIGKDIYCDTRLMLLKLNELFPGSAMEASTPDQKAIQQLLQTWTIDGGIFFRASQLIPSNMPLLNDPKFTKDREQFSGRPWSREAIDANRPEAVAVIRNGFDFLESGLLADGREWILKTDKPTMADIEAIWPFDWLNGLKGGLPKDLISEKQFPKVFAWMARFNTAIKAANEKAPKPVKLKGPDAAQRIFKSGFAEQDGEVDPMDPTAFKKGTKVDVWPIDSGFSHKDQGTLLTLNGEEIVIGLENGLRLHVPRHGFRVKQAGSQKKSKL